MAEQLVPKVRSKLRQMTDSQDSVRLVSLWFIKHKEETTQLAGIWRDEFLNATPKQRLLLLYVANDVIQNSRKRAPGMKPAFQPHIRDALALASKDIQFKSAISKIVRVWTDRGVFPKDVLVGFDRALNSKAISGGSSAAAATSASSHKSSRSSRPRSVHDFQVASLAEAMQNFKQFSSEVALKHAALAGIRTDVRRSDIANNVKDRTTGGRLLEELGEARTKLSDYCDSVNVELQDRRHMLSLLDNGLAYHQSRLLQAKAIQEEFSAISKRVKNVRGRLAAKRPTLPSAADCLIAAAGDGGSPEPPAVEALSPVGADQAPGSRPYDPVMDIHEVADMELDQSDEEPPEPSPPPSPGLPSSSSSSAANTSSPMVGSAGAAQGSVERASFAYGSAAPTAGIAGDQFPGSAAAAGRTASPGTPSYSAPPSPGTPDDSELPPGHDTEDVPAAAGGSQPQQHQQPSSSSSNMLNILTRLLGQQRANEVQSGTVGSESPATRATTSSLGAGASLSSPSSLSRGDKPLSEILDSILPTLVGTLQKVQAAAPAGMPSAQASYAAMGAAMTTTTGSGGGVDRSSTGVDSSNRPQPLALSSAPMSAAAAMIGDDPLANMASIAGFTSPSWAQSSSAAAPLLGSAGLQSTAASGNAMQAFQAISSPSATAPRSSVPLLASADGAGGGMSGAHQRSAAAQNPFSPPPHVAMANMAFAPPAGGAPLLPPIPPPGMPPFPAAFMAGPPQPPGNFPPPGMHPAGFNPVGGPPPQFPGGGGGGGGPLLPHPSGVPRPASAMMTLADPGSVSGGNNSSGGGGHVSDGMNHGDETPPLEELEASDNAAAAAAAGHTFPPYQPMSLAPDIGQSLSSGVGMRPGNNNTNSNNSNNNNSNSFPSVSQSASSPAGPYSQHGQFPTTTPSGAGGGVGSSGNSSSGGGGGDHLHRPRHQPPPVANWQEPLKRSHLDASAGAPAAQRREPWQQQQQQQEKLPQSSGYFDTGFDSGDQTPPWQPDPPTPAPLGGSGGGVRNEWPSWN